MSSLNTGINLSLQQSSQRSRQQKNLAATKEGILVNNFIKTNNGYSVYIPQNTFMPEDLDNRKEPISKSIFSNPLIPLMLAPLVLLGGGAAFSKLYKNAFAAKQKLSPEKALPNIGRIITLNDDNTLVLYLLMQDPGPKSLLAATGVLAASSVGFILKNFVDGFKEIWVKKREADIKRNLEESLVDVETRSFSGKNQILRNMLVQHANQLLEYLPKPGKTEISPAFKGFDRNIYAQFLNKTSISDKITSFKQNENKKPAHKKNWFYLAAGIGTFLSSFLLARLMFKNIRQIADKAESVRKQIQKQAQKEFNDLLDIPADRLEAEIAGKEILSNQNKNTLLRKIASAKDSKKKVKFVVEDESVYELAHRAMGGGENKISFISAVRDMTAFLYTYIVNPNEQTRNLLLLLTSAASLTYLGKNAVQAVKEVQVKKSEADIELKLQDRLVQVELMNFLAKKNSYINPLIEEFKNYAKENPNDREKLEKMYSNILEEIKNGPPFVYA